MRQVKINGKEVIIPDPKEELWVMIDAGNKDIKGMIFPQFGQEIFFPHSVALRDQSQWEIDCTQWENRQYDQISSVAFKTPREGAFLVGKQAEQSGGYSIYGAEKYTRDHMGVLVRAMLYRLYPAGHDNVKLVIMHPTRLNIASRNELVKSVIGKHKMELPDGRRLQFTVTEVFPLEEAVAAFQTFLLSTNGERYKSSSDNEFGGDAANFIPGEEFINIDVGGYVSYIGTGVINDNGGVEMNNYNAQPIEAGIWNVYDVLNESIRNNTKRFPGVSSLTRLPEPMLREAVLTGMVTIKRRKYECEEEVIAAMNVLINAMKPEFSGRFRNGVMAAVITISGGGGGLAFNHLVYGEDRKNFLIDHEFVYQVEKEFDNMRYGSVRGAAKGTFLAIKDRIKNAKK